MHKLKKPAKIAREREKEKELLALPVNPVEMNEICRFTYTRASSIVAPDRFAGLRARHVYARVHVHRHACVHECNGVLGQTANLTAVKHGVAK